MGSATSKFRQHLKNGDECAALQMFQSTHELRHGMDPNIPCGDSVQRNSALHIVAQHGMKALLRIFLMELKGNPNKKNASGENTLHLVCQTPSSSSSVAQERKHQCLMIILQWKNEKLERVDLSIKDNDGNTALHHAAASGLKKCVESLVKYGAPLFVENKYGETPCDLAEKNSHKSIAEFFESKMVFSTDFVDEPVADAPYLFSNEEIFNGLRAQDLQEAKDQLLVETSDMLHVPLFTAEVLLRNHEWSRQSLLESWMSDPVVCCEEAGISPPTSALQFSISSNSLKLSCERVQEEYQNETLNSPAKSVPLEAEFLCEICNWNIPFGEEPVQVPCSHRFCRNCWREYLSVKIQEGGAHNILCPAYLCHYLVPIDVIENVVSTEMIRRYLHFDIEAFVETNPKIKWCPFPSCGRAVKLPDIQPLPQEVISISGASPPEVSHSVDCGNGHYFCWECLGEAHAPVSCQKWKEWFDKIADIKPQEMQNTCSDTEDAANWLWMVTNSKPCPNCKSPIQKNEGCNHMKCTKCKFEYCWVCLEGWKKHSPATGGYFRCNRFDAVQKAEIKAGALISEAEAHNKNMQELKKFLHYYTRFRNHENSYKFELPLLETTLDKMQNLELFLQAFPNTDITVQFLEDAIYELLRSRRILCGSYVFGFYLEDNGYNKTIFEIMQSELEEGTEKLSEMVACSYIQKPRSKIIQATNQVKRKRIDFITAVLKGLIPPETPPSLRKSHRKRYPGLMGIDPAEDEELSQAILASLEALDPNNPWVKDQQGKHTNLVALCDWPYVDSDDEEDSMTAVAASLLGVCKRKDCTKPKARNCRTGAMHDYCSLSCKHEAMNCISEDSERHDDIMVDPSMDLLIALELSKREMENNLLPLSSSNVLSTDSDQYTLPKKCIDDPEDFNACSMAQREFINENEEGAESTLFDPTADPKTNQLEELFNCDKPSALFEASSNTESFSSPSKVALSFYMKISCDTNSKNIDTSVDSGHKTEKALFVPGSKCNTIEENAQSSKWSL